MRIVVCTGQSPHCNQLDEQVQSAGNRDSVERQAASLEGEAATTQRGAAVAAVHASACVEVVGALAGIVAAVAAA